MRLELKTEEIAGDKDRKTEESQTVGWKTGLFLAIKDEPVFR